MGKSGLAAFDRTIEKTNRWLQEIEGDLGTDRQNAYRALRAVLLALRERLPNEEVADLSAQLPLLVRGIFFDGWDPRALSRITTREEFLNRVREHLRDGPPLDVEAACRAVLDTVQRHVSPGEIEDVRSVLPRQLQELLRPQA